MVILARRKRENRRYSIPIIIISITDFIIVNYSNRQRKIVMPLRGIPGLQAG
jgi:hypothetical protein